MAFVKRPRLGINPGCYDRGPQLLSRENRRKIEPKETPCCFISRLLVVFTAQQLEILVTTLKTTNNITDYLQTLKTVNNSDMSGMLLSDQSRQ